MMGKKNGLFTFEKFAIPREKVPDASAGSSSVPAFRSVDENVFSVRSRLDMGEDELLHVFLTMLNDSFRSLIHVITWLKESIVQRS
jgi:hypothetical protein